MPDTASPEPTSAPSQSAGKLSDLGTRLVSGLTLAVAALAALFSGLYPFAIAVLLVALIMSWEWGRIVRSGGLDLPFVIHAAVVAIAAVLATFGMAALGLVVLAAGTILLGTVMFRQQPVLSAAGVLYTGLPALALVWIRGDIPYGLPALLFLLIAVATTDTFAFLTGRLVGGPKLMPSVSPKKTWSGLVGGVGAAGVAGLIFAWMLEIPLQPVAIGGVLLGLVSQAGDLAESALKRARNVKDASGLIPGHGGFMDRMDGIVAAAIAVGLSALFTNPTAPAHVLLFWN